MNRFVSLPLLYNQLTTKTNGQLIVNLLARTSACQQRNISISSRLFNHNKDFRPSEELAKERYDTRADEDVDRKRSRLLYQSRKRGMLENGVILSSFADKYLHKFDASELDQYDRLINLPTNDWDIFYWATKTKPTPPEFETPVMEKLRQHLHSKVSSESDQIMSGRPSLLDGKRGEDIVVEPSKREYQLDLDIHNVDFSNYDKELFDDRIKILDPRNYIQNMTNWRKHRFTRRVRRAISSPVSLRNMSDDTSGPIEVYSQLAKNDGKIVAKNPVTTNQVIESKYDQALRHHNFIQFLMSSKFTFNVDDYEEEVKAWSDIIWHRNYGFSDIYAAPARYKCKTCNSKLQCCDPGTVGYLPRELFSKLYDPNLSKEVDCQGCKFSGTYNTSLGLEVNRFQFETIYGSLAMKQSSIVCLLVDLTDFPNSIPKGVIDIIGVQHSIIVVANKLDLLPYDTQFMIDRVLESVRNNLARVRKNNVNLQINDVVPISARTGFGVEGLISRILTHCEKPRDVYLIGSSNSGKSTLFNTLLQSDLCAIRDADLISRVSKAKLPCNINTLKFPVKNLEGWEIEMKKRKTHMVERDYGKFERSFQNMTSCRQATTPHMSYLASRLNFPPIENSGSKVIPLYGKLDKDHEAESVPQFTEDHPLLSVKELPPLAATAEAWPHHGFCHQYPSITTQDQLHDLLTFEEKFEVFPHETIKPRKYSLRPMQSIFIAGLARLDLVTSTSTVIVTIFASRYLPVHVIETKKADQFYRTFIGSPYLGIPFGDEQRMKRWPKRLLSNKNSEYLIRGSEYRAGMADIVLSSAGWALIDCPRDQDCIVKAYTPEARGIYYRSPPMVSQTREAIKGKKIRDTPLFRNADYRIESISKN